MYASATEAAAAVKGVAEALLSAMKRTRPAWGTSIGSALQLGVCEWRQRGLRFLTQTSLPLWLTAAWQADQEVMQPPAAQS